MELSQIQTILASSWKGLYYKAITLTYTEHPNSIEEDLLSWLRPGDILYYVVELTKNGMPHIHGIVRTNHRGPLGEWLNGRTQFRRLFKTATKNHMSYHRWIHYLFKYNSTARQLPSANATPEENLHNLDKIVTTLVKTRTKLDLIEERIRKSVLDLNEFEDLNDFLCSQPDKPRCFTIILKKQIKLHIKLIPKNI